MEHDKKLSPAIDEETLLKLAKARLELCELLASVVLTGREVVPWIGANLAQAVVLTGLDQVVVEVTQTHSVRGVRVHWLFCERSNPHCVVTVVLAWNALGAFALGLVKTALDSQLSVVIDQLLPDQAFAQSVLIGADSISEHVQDQQNVRNWAISRQEEYRAGRCCAREALATGGFAGVNELRADEDGLPEWPEGVLGSITHSKGLCVAVVAGDSQLGLLGVDLERTDRIGAAAMKRVIHPREADFARDDQRKASILFSLKEAFYKAQFARWRIAGNFHDLALDVDVAAGGAAVREISPHFGAELVDSADELRFRFGLFANYVVSLCWRER